jgi:protein translocase SecG subunit
MSIIAILTYIQLGSAVGLIVTILLQQRGSGLGSGMGGGSSAEFSTKRGVEKSVFTASIVLAVVFLASSIARLFVA